MNSENRYGDVTLRRDYDTGEVEIVDAAPLSLMSLGVLAQADAIRVVGADELLIATKNPVTYRVVGWEPFRMALVIERVDRR